MDKFIRNFPGGVSGDLTLCPAHGVAYQTDMKVTAEYGDDYFNKCSSYDGSDIERQLNKGRRDFVDRWVGHNRKVVDIGIGSGAFVRERPQTWGIDINPRAIDWLLTNEKWADGAMFLFDAFTMWDVIEHLVEPEIYLRQMRQGSYLFASIPTFPDLRSIRQSKHYRPGEHLYYFTPWGFPLWLRLYGFRSLGVTDFETRAGREGITSYVFRRDYPEERPAL